MLRFRFFSILLACCWAKLATELLHAAVAMLEYADGLYISEIQMKSMPIKHCWLRTV